MVVALLSFCSPNQEYKENFQELFEKIDQEDDGEVYLRFDKFFKVRDPNYTPITTLFHYNYNSTFITMPTSEKSLCSGKLFSSYGLSTKMSIRMRRYLRSYLQYLTKLYLQYLIRFYLQYLTKCYFQNFLSKVKNLLDQYDTNGEKVLHFPQFCVSSKHKHIITMIASAGNHQQDIISRISSAGYHQQDIIIRISSPGYHHKEIISRISSPGYHHQDIITRISSPGYHHQDIITRISTPGYQNQDIITRIL